MSSMRAKNLARLARILRNLTVRNRLTAVTALAGLLVLSGCGSPQGASSSPGGFGMLVSTPSTNSAGPESAAALAELKLAESSVVGGSSTTITVTLAHPAPAGGVRILITSSEAAVVQTPSSLEIESGQSSVYFSVSTSAVTAAVPVTVSAQAENSTVGAALSVLPPASAPFTVTVPPAVVTVPQGTSGSATATTKTTNPNAKFKGCWHRQNGHRYQAVDISVGNPGTYPFNAILYRGATCNPNDVADQFGFGQPLNFGGFGYTFWFTDFRDQTNMSALWYVGSQHSQCVSYATAPNC